MSDDKVTYIFGKRKLVPDINPSLTVSSVTGKVSGSPQFKLPESNDFGDRLSRVRTSLAKINKLMAELKEMSKDES